MQLKKSASIKYPVITYYFHEPPILILHTHRLHGYLRIRQTSLRFFSCIKHHAVIQLEYLNDSENKRNVSYERWALMENNNQNYNITEEYRPVSMWGFLGYRILFALPCVGFILILVFSFGATKNLTIRNFARSYLCFLLLLVIIGIISLILSSLVGFVSGL